MKIAYIGNGKATNRYHIPFAQQVKEIDISKIYSPSGRRDWPTVAGVTYTTNINDILEDNSLDLVVIATPLDSHYPLAKQSLLAGKNVLLEKPFTETANQAKELFALAKERGLFLQAYQNRRFDSDFLTVQKVIESGKLGDIFEVEMHYDYFRPEVPNSQTAFTKHTSFLYGHGCHTIDQVLSYWGHPERVSFDVKALLGQGRMNDYFDLDFFYKTFKVSIKSSYFRIKARPSFAIYGRRGQFIKRTKDRQEEDLKKFYMPSNPDFGLDRLEDYGVLTYQDDDGFLHEEKVISERGDYSRFYQAVYHSVIHGKAKLIKDEDTIKQIELLEKGVAGMF